MRFACALAIALACLGAAPPAAADAPSPEPASGDEGVEPSVGMRTLGVFTSLVPGALLHGAGHFLIGRRRTAYRLLAIQGIGLGMVIIAGIPLALSGASRYIAREAAVHGALGVGLFAITLQADIYGTAVPLDARGTHEPTLSHLEAEAGYRYVYDPHFRYANFIYNAVDLRSGSLRLSPSAQWALDDGNRRLRLEAAHRFFGPMAAHKRSRDGSFLEIKTAFTHHAFLPERFATLTAEVVSSGRLELEHVDPLLRGCFGELAVGFGLQIFDYDALPTGEDVESLLLVRMGFGFHIGGPAAPAGEVLSYYDHRHDDYVGGFTEASIGVPGHVGFSGRGWLHDNVGLSAIFEAGAAIMVGGSLLFRETPP